MPNYNPPKENFFKTDKKESCTAHLSVKVPPSLLKKIKEQKDWQDFVRDTLAEKIKEIKTN